MVLRATVFGEGHEAEERRRSLKISTKCGNNLRAGRATYVLEEVEEDEEKELESCERERPSWDKRLQMIGKGMVRTTESLHSF